MFPYEFAARVLGTKVGAFVEKLRAANGGLAQVADLLAKGKRRKRYVLPRKIEEAPLNKPVKATRIKQAAFLREPAFQAGCRGFEPRLPLHRIDRLSRRASQAV